MVYICAVVENRAYSIREFQDYTIVKWLCCTPLKSNMEYNRYITQGID